MGVALGAADVFVPEQLAGHVERLAGLQRVAGVGVAQVVQSEACVDPGGFFERLPCAGH